MYVTRRRNLFVDVFLPEHFILSGLLRAIIEVFEKHLLRKRLSRNALGVIQIISRNVVGEVPI